MDVAVNSKGHFTRENMEVMLRALATASMAGTDRKKKQELTPLQREAICSAVSAGNTHRAVAAAFRISPSTVRGTIDRSSKDPSFSSKPRPGRPPKVTDDVRRQILSMVSQPGKRPSYREIVDRLDSKVSHKTVARFMRAHEKITAAALAAGGEGGALDLDDQTLQKALEQQMDQELDQDMELDADQSTGHTTELELGQQQARFQVRDQVPGQDS